MPMLRKRATPGPAVLHWTLLATLSGSATAQAASFDVTSTTDAPDALPGDGLCASTAAASPCTLRAALQEANALAGKDTILLDTGTYTLTVAGTSEDHAATGDLDILEDVAIKGQGPAATIIDGNHIDRVFDCAPQTVLTSATPVDARISRLRIRNGSTGSGGGAIVYACDLHLYEVDLRDNYALTGGALYADSGSIFDPVSPTLEVIHSNFRENEALSTGAIDLTNGDAASIRESRFVGNTSSLSPAAIDAYQASTEIKDCHFQDHTGFMGVLTGAYLTISGSTFVDNYSTSNNAVVTTTGPSLITNSTFSNNHGYQGGAVCTNNALTVNNSTFVDNWSLGTGSYIGGALMPFGSGSSVTLSNTIMFGNGTSCPRALTTLGHNLSDDATCGLTGTGDYENTWADLDAILSDNGGPTWTHALMPTSWAIDRGSPDTSGAGICAAHDQRQASRPIRGNPSSFGVLCDMGAYEYCPDGTTGPDFDHDGLPDKCDPDDDDDGCFDAYDHHVRRSMAKGGPLVGTCGPDVWYYYEGLDNDGDGLLDCEDHDDDDDGVDDEDDFCPTYANLAACARPGMLCPERWFRCWGSECYEWFIKFQSVVDPPDYVRFDRFERYNDTLYLSPLKGTTAAQSIQRIAGAAPQAQLRALATKSSAYRLEVWKLGAAGSKDELLGVLAEYDRNAIRLGALDATAGFIRLDVPSKKGDTLRLSTSWAVGLEAGQQLSDADGDGVPSAHDNCSWTANRDQLDKNGNGIGEACEPQGQR